MSGAGALCNLGLINQLHLDNATHAEDWYSFIFITLEPRVQ
jgi:hypothetical protein